MRVRTSVGNRSAQISRYAELFTERRSRRRVTTFVDTIGHMLRVRKVLEEHGGVARRSDFDHAGVRRRELERAVAGGHAIRVRKGVYALPDADRDTVTAARHGGELACGSALRAHGVWVLDVTEQAAVDGGRSPDRVEPDKDAVAARARNPHVWIGTSGRQHAHPGCRCRTHHEVWDRAPGLGVVGVLLALVQFAVCATNERFFAALESALRLGLVTDAGVRLLRSRVSPAMRWVVDLADSSAESGLESLLRFRLHLLGISLRAQVSIAGVGRVDFLLGGRIILEVDGRENHDGQSLRHKDLMRDAAAAAQGYETLRFDYAMVVYHWDVVLAAIIGRLRVVDPASAQEVAAAVQDARHVSGPMAGVSALDRMTAPA